MAQFLCIETSTINCSVALFEDNNLISLKESANGYQHAELLHSFIQEIVSKNNIVKPDAIIVGKGPGSYTGLRIGVSAAKGLCFAWQIPLISVDSLQTIAFGVLRDKSLASNELICSMTDARRMEVYTALYNHCGNRINAISAEIISAHSFSDILKKNKIYFAGDGMNKCKLTLANKNSIFIENILPSAKYLIHNGIEKYNAKEFENLAYFEPFYLKEFIGTIAKEKL